MEKDYKESNCITIASIAYRKRKDLTHIELPTNLCSIGDAAFSYCISLHDIVLPETISFIGVAAFCGSGLETVCFKGIPDVIEPAIFKCCKHLKRINVPKGSKKRFNRMLDVDKRLIIEGSGIIQIADDLSHTITKFSEKKRKQVTFNYNFQEFKWSCGDEVLLNELFSGPTTLMGNPSFQFRRKALFIFVQSNIANKLEKKKEYEIPANVSFFSRKYQEKYPTKTPRIFIFICNNGKVARVYDEVVYVKTNRNSITVKSLLRI